MGDLVMIAFGSYGTSRLRIGGIFTSQCPLSGYLISNAVFTADTGIRADNVDLVRAPRSARGPLRTALAGYPGAQLLDQAGYAHGRSAALGNILTLITALLVLTVIIACWIRADPWAIMPTRSVPAGAKADRPARGRWAARSIGRA